MGDRPARLVALGARPRSNPDATRRTLFRGVSIVLIPTKPPTRVLRFRNRRSWPDRNPYAGLRCFRRRRVPIRAQEHSRRDCGPEEARSDRRRPRPDSATAMRAKRCRGRHRSRCSGWRRALNRRPARFRGSGWQRNRGCVPASARGIEGRGPPAFLRLGLVG